MHRYTSAQARGLRTASPNQEQQRSALRDRLNETAASSNAIGSQETSAAYYGAQAAAYTSHHRSQSVYVDKYGSPTTIPAQPHRQISSSASSWTQGLSNTTGSQFHLGPTTSAAKTNRGFTITAPSGTATLTRSTSGSQAAATAPVATTPYTVQSWRPGANQVSSGSSATSPPSVKHLTCYFWDKYGKCKWTDAECLYAHFQTGKVAGGPVQVEIGRPAVAGKNASAPKPVYESWRNHLAPSSSYSTSPVSPLQLTTPPNNTQDQKHPALGASPHTNNPGSDGTQSQNPIGTPRTTPGTGADNEVDSSAAKYSAAAEKLYYQQRAQISTLCTAVSLLGACLGSSHESMQRFKETLSEEGTALVKLAKDMQGWEGGAGGGNGRVGGGGGRFAGGGGRFPAEGGGGRFGWGRQGEEELGSKRLLETVQKICDVIDAQKHLVREMQDVKSHLHGMLGEVGLDGMGIVEGEGEGVWDEGSK